MPYPSWLIKKIPKSSNIAKIRFLLNDSLIHTVCEEASCPNIGECFSNKTATFMILGNTCTRNCAFCGVKSGTPLPLGADEPKRIAEAAKKLNIKYVVITSVTRDDLPDGGARQFALTINEIRHSVETGQCPVSTNIKIEVLIPDFQGNASSLQKIVDCKPNIINHNLETVERLYPKIRPQADYKRSLELLKNAKNTKNHLYPHTNSKINNLNKNNIFEKNAAEFLDNDSRGIGAGVYTKSGIMVGLGEKKNEVVSLMEDLRSVGCDIMTIGQYLRPSSSQIAEVQYIEPQIFEDYRLTGEAMGFKKVFSGPLVRSSYKASETNEI